MNGTFIGVKDCFRWDHCNSSTACANITAQGDGSGISFRRCDASCCSENLCNQYLPASWSPSPTVPATSSMSQTAATKAEDEASSNCCRHKLEGCVLSVHLFVCCNSNNELSSQLRKKTSSDLLYFSYQHYFVSDCFKTCLKTSEPGAHNRITIRPAPKTVSVYPWNRKLRRDKKQLSGGRAVVCSEQGGKKRPDHTFWLGHVRFTALRTSPLLVPQASRQTRPLAC